MGEGVNVLMPENISTQANAPPLHGILFEEAEISFKMT